MIKKILTIIMLNIILTTCIDPPLLDQSFQIAFDQTYVQNGSHIKINGVFYYDSTKNRQRVDRANGRYSLVCGSVLPDVTTPCTHLIVQNKRWVYYPQKRQCCMCCTSQQGCGILKRNWLQGAIYMGRQRIIDTQYDGWSKDGTVGYNHFWVTTDSNKIPRRLDQAGTHITDFLVHTFNNKTFDDSYFALPTYCNSTCPSTTICGKFTKDYQLSDYQQ